MTPKAQADAAKRAEAIRKVHASLAGLRTDWKNALSHYTLQSEARFRELAAIVDRQEKGARPKLHDLQKLEATLSGTRLKPAKGRLRDLRRVDHLLKDILGDLPE